MKRAPLTVLIAFVACSRTPESAPPVVAVEPAGSSSRIETTPAPTSPPPADTPGGCEGGFVEVVDGAKTTRYVLGREIDGERGAKHVYIEEVIHPNGQTVLHLAGVANADGYGGHLSLTVLEFAEPASLPATYENGYAEYAGPGEGGERRMNHPRVEITKWSAEGGWVEGTFGEGAAPPVMSAVPVPASAMRPYASGSASLPPPRRIAIATAPYRGRFRVCRSKDWRVRR